MNDKPKGLGLLRAAADEIDELYAKLEASRFVCAELKRELLELKGPCSNKRCRLHYAHSGPCDESAPKTEATPMDSQQGGGDRPTAPVCDCLL